MAVVVTGPPRAERRRLAFRRSIPGHFTPSTLHLAVIRLRAPGHSRQESDGLVRPGGGEALEFCTELAVDLV